MELKKRVLESEKWPLKRKYFLIKMHNLRFTLRFPLSMMWIYFLLSCTVLYALSWLSQAVNFLCKHVLYSLIYLITAVLHLLYCPFFPKNRDNTYTLAPFFYHLSRFAYPSLFILLCLGWWVCQVMSVKSTI